MPNQWDPEVEIAPSLAARLVDEQFPDLAPSTAVPIGAGWDNSAFEVNGRYVFRFPRREAALLGIRAELVVLPNIAARMSLPIPNPTFIGVPGVDYPFPFVGYPMIHGRTACSADLPDEVRARSAVVLGRFLRDLHKIDGAEAESIGAVADFQRKTDTAYHGPRMVEYLCQLASMGLLDRPERFDRMLAEGGTLKHCRSTLIHGDLYVRHLLVDQDGIVCGVIDWGDVCYGDPAADLCIAHSFLPPSAHDDFRAGYGPIPDDTWLIARFRALQYAATLLHFGHDTSDADLLRESATILRYLEVPID